MTILPGIGLILAIAIVAGAIAYIGDRVGHQVGRKRLTLFGLRPKYTSTIVAIATGMLIALSVTLAAVIASSTVRTAFFRMGQLNAQISSLQAQALAAQSELQTTRDSRIVLQKGTPVTVFYRFLDLSKPQEGQLRDISALFDETVGYVNEALTKAPFNLRANPRRSSDASTRALLERELELIHTLADRAGTGSKVPVLLLPEASQNLFAGETISFSFASYLDVKIASAGETVAGIDVSGGAPPSLLDAQTLFSRAATRLAERQYPPPFLRPPSTYIDPAKWQQISLELARSRGQYRIVAQPAADVYPHSIAGAVQLSVALVPRG